MATIARWRHHVNAALLNDPAVAQALAPVRIEKTARQVGHRWRESFWSPATTVMTFLLQVLSAEKSLRAAVAALLVQLTARGPDGRLAQPRPQRLLPGPPAAARVAC